MSAVLPGFAGRELDENALTRQRMMRSSAELLPLPEPGPGDLFAAATPAGEGAATELSGEADLTTPRETPERVPVSQSLTINLINRLVARGVLTKEDSAELMQLAQADVAHAKAEAAAREEALVTAAVTQALAAAQSMPSPNPDAELYEAAAKDGVRVTYIPENVRAQMTEEIREEVMAKAREERWAAPRLLPEWTTRIKLFGDIRTRYEGVFFPEGNDNTGSFPNFNSINTGAPFDVSGTVFSPQLNVDEDRHRFRLRARLGAEADLGGGFSAGLRIATGENNSPTSTNQSLGLANQGQGGNFSKYAIWLDRGFLKWEAGPNPNKKIELTLGRFENPFFSSEIVWDEDVGFDGAALRARYEVVRGFTPFIAGGAFPVFNTDFNFATNQPDKFSSTDKYLYGGQLGADVKLHKDVQIKFGAAYYHFDGVEGRLSDPFLPLTAQDQGNTDNTRPSFAQKGNTYRPLRNIIASPLNNFGTSQQFQYFGLATPFEELALTGRLDFNRWEPVQLSLSGEWIKNLAFDRDAINAIAVNNRGPNNAIGGIGDFDGGDTAWMVNFRAGSAALQKLWDWQAGVNYRHVESDAVVDAFADSDFGLGGTNLKGYTLYGVLALGPRAAVGVRWMSADEVAGPPLSVDIIQVDFTGKF